MSNSILKNAFYRIMLNAFNLIIPIVTGPYLARILDMELYGVYNKAVSELVVFNIIAAFGIYNYAVREVAKLRDSKEKGEALFTSLFILNIFSTGISCLLYYLYVKLTMSTNSVYIYIYNIRNTTCG